MRLDRLITLNVVRPLRLLGHAFVRTSHLAPRTSGRVLPILMYHSISDDPEPHVHPYYRVCTGPKRFAEHMQWLKRAGYRGVTLHEGLAWLNELPATNPRPSDTPSPGARERVAEGQVRAAGEWRGCPDGVGEGCRRQWSGDRPVALTFDDGLHDFYTAAWPVLQENGFRATMYLPTAFIGEQRRVFAPRPSDGRGIQGEGKASYASSATPDSQLRTSSSNSKSCLTWNEVRELHSAGIEFGSHTASHPKLVDLYWDRIDDELRTSISELQSRLGQAVDSFAYPYAFPQANRPFAARFCTALRGAGYTNCVTTAIGCATARDDRFRLKRLPVNGDDDTSLFSAKLEDCYSWLAALQRIVKEAKRLGGP